MIAWFGQDWNILHLSNLCVFMLFNALIRLFQFAMRYFSVTRQSGRACVGSSARTRRSPFLNFSFAPFVVSFFVQITYLNDVINQNIHWQYILIFVIQFKSDWSSCCLEDDIPGCICNPFRFFPFEEIRSCVGCSNALYCAAHECFQTNDVVNKDCIKNIYS